MIFRPLNYYGGSVTNAREVADAQQSARSAERRVEELESQVDKLTIACAAMWELLQERTGLTEDQLAQKMGEIDLRDGREDGKITASVYKCTKCARPVASRHTKCLYCGEPQPLGGVFEMIP